MKQLQQYKEIKAKYSDAVLLFRVGDYYHAYAGDAELLSKLFRLSLLTTEDETIRCNTSFPHYHLDDYLRKLVKAGHKVAIREELEIPKHTSRVRRGVTDFRKP